MFKGVNIAEFYTSSKKFATDQKCCYTLFITDIFFHQKQSETSFAFMWLT